MLIDTIGIVLANIIIILTIYRLNNKTITIKDKKMIFSIVIYNIMALINVNMNDTFDVVNFIMPIVHILVLFFVQFFVMKDNLQKCFASIVVIYSMVLISEVLTILLVVLLNEAYYADKIVHIINDLSNDVIMSFIINISCTLLVFFLCGTTRVQKFYKKANDFYRKLKFKKIFALFIFIFISILLVYIIICYSNNLAVTLAMFIIFLVFILIILIRDLNVRSEYAEAKEKYNSIQQTLLEYEEMIDKYRVNNHENKNQLLTIQNMLKHNDKKINAYIENLVGNVYRTNEKTMMDVSIIPAGGLRATIHTKLNIMDNKSIKYILNIDRKLRTIDFENISSETNLKICKIISIFIDNAIDETETHDDKLVNIEMYLDINRIVIEISNKFKNNFDINRMFEKQYTTKTLGHGYGLSLAKELIDSENILNNISKIEDDIFTQVLEIDLENKKRN